MFPDTKNSKAFLGQASIGQFSTQATPLEMALVTAGVANGGIIMSPHVMKEIRDDNGKVIDTFDPKPWRTAVSPQTAATMRQAMIGVVQGGTGTAARIPGVEVGGKTGTAELDDAGSQSEAWFTCFAGPARRPAPGRRDRARREPARGQRRHRRPGGGADRRSSSIQQALAVQ